MTATHQSYYLCIRRTLEAALCIGNYPSRTMERHSKPEVEVADMSTRDASPDSRRNLPGPSPSSLPLRRSVIPLEPTLGLLLNPLRICRSTQEVCFIESSVNSVRVSLSFLKSDPVTSLMVHKYVDFMGQRASQFRILRRRPLDGYDVSFLITHTDVETMGRAKIIDFIIAFARSVDADAAALKLMLNERSRAAAAEICRSFRGSA